MSRSDCPQCRRPLSRCVCAAIRPVSNATGVTVVQHPAERNHPFNTARLARMALDHIAVEVAWKGAIDQPDLPPGTALLYPGDDARDLASLPSQDRPRGRSLTRTPSFM